MSRDPMHHEAIAAALTIMGWEAYYAERMMPVTAAYYGHELFHEATGVNLLLRKNGAVIELGDISISDFGGYEHTTIVLVPAKQLLEFWEYIRNMQVPQ